MKHAEAGRKSPEGWQVDRVGGHRRHDRGEIEAFRGRSAKEAWCRSVSRVEEAVVLPRGPCLPGADK